MRIFRIQSNGQFRELEEAPLQGEYDERTLETWLEDNPEGIMKDGSLLMIGRQVRTNLGGAIDLLGVDRRGDVAVIELKGGRTPRDVVAQALEYASFAVQLDPSQLNDILRNYLNDESVNLAEYHREYFGISSEEAVSFNKDQLIVIVGQDISQAVRETALFLRRKGIRVNCVEFTLFQEPNARLLSQEIVVGGEPERQRSILSGSRPVIDRDEFIESLDDNGKEVFSAIFDLADEKGLLFHWGTKGFSLNVDLNGTHVAVCLGYPPDSVYKQSVYTSFISKGGMTKTAVPPDEIAQLREKAEASGLFVPAGKEIKCVIDRRLAEEEISWLVKWLDSVAKVIGKHGLPE